MKVSQVMSDHPVTVRSGAGVRAALGLLASHAITTVPVVDAHGRIIGVVGERELLDAGSEANTVDGVMRTSIVVVNPETDVEEVGRILQTTQVKSLPVVDAADQVVGMVSRSDIVRMLARDDDELEEAVVDALCAAGLSGWRVDVRNGVVELTAPAGTTADPTLARRTAAGALGVDSVRML